MSDFRRFYSYGLEHRLHLEQLERSALQSKAVSVGSEKKITGIRRVMALALKTLAARIDPSGVPRGNRVADTAFSRACATADRKNPPCPSPPFRAA